MQNKYSYIYESAQNDHFERSIMSGHLTESMLLEMINNNELSDTQIAIAEGLFDRLRSRGQQAVAGAKGLGQQIAGGTKQAAGNLVGKVANAGAGFFGPADGSGGPSGGQIMAQNLQAQGQAQSAHGKTMGNTAKTQSYLTNTVSTIINDLKSLNIPVSDPQALSRELSQVLVKYVQGNGNQANVNPGSAGPAYAQNPAPSQFTPARPARTAPPARPRGGAPRMRAQ